MDELVYVRIRSWHLIRHALGVATHLTGCGRTVSDDAPRQVTLPAEKTCETCFRALAAEVAKDQAVPSE